MGGTVCHLATDGMQKKSSNDSSGETEHYIYCVTEGLQRAFYIGNEGQEATIVFSYPPSFSGLADSFLTQTPSKYFLETLTASKFLRTSHKQFTDLMFKYPNIRYLVLKATAFAIKGVLERRMLFTFLGKSHSRRRPAGDDYL